MDVRTLITKPSAGYELLDTGGEEKLERYGDVVLARPDPQALWSKRLPEEEWAKAVGRYVRKGKNGEWKTKSTLPKEWEISFGDMTFIIKPTSFKHTGLFPEQLPNWQWIAHKLKAVTGNRTPSVLNLFAYTGGATLAAAKAGASVTHVDASKGVVDWAKRNAEASKLSERPIRWIVDDVTAFLKREVKRGVTYDGVIMDPPAFGHGPKDELWKMEESLLPLMKLVEQVLSDKPLFVLMNGYASGYSHLAFRHNLLPLTEKLGGEIESGELTIEESPTKPPPFLVVHKEDQPQRLLPAGIFARLSL